MKVENFTVPFAFCLLVSGSAAYSADVKEMVHSNEMRKATEQVSYGIEFFGYPFLTFDKPNQRNPNNIVGFKNIRVWDKGKLVTVTVTDEEWQETRARTTHGCVPGRRLEKANFTVIVKQQAPADKASKDIKGTDVKLVSVEYYEDRKKP